MQPHLFQNAVETEFGKLAEARAAEEQQEQGEASGTDLILYQ